MFTGSSCTRREEVEGLAQGRGLAARGGAESLAPGLNETTHLKMKIPCDTTIFIGPAPDLGPDPGPSLGTVPGPGLGPGDLQRRFNQNVEQFLPGLVAGRGPGTPEAEADHEMFKESYKQTI